ncbi:hypothetical protein MVES_003402 [Malassezia vespertilionis]|uniref:Uncharacterized protein n=2 Tax=Malassezia vespertilionis TaxID=2020962 RepID=A0A2N1J7R5_9BASI|nr:hypothetical protein MVES_003402 [Malassezia vespertilionis]
MTSTDMRRRDSMLRSLSGGTFASNDLQESEEEEDADIETMEQLRAARRRLHAQDTLGWENPSEETLSMPDQSRCRTQVEAESTEGGVLRRRRKSSIGATQLPKTDLKIDLRSLPRTSWLEAERRRVGRAQGMRVSQSPDSNKVCGPMCPTLDTASASHFGEAGYIALEPKEWTWKSNGAEMADAVDTIPRAANAEMEWTWVFSTEPKAGVTINL